MQRQGTQLQGGEGVMLSCLHCQAAFPFGLMQGHRTRNAIKMRCSMECEHFIAFYNAEERMQ